MSTSGASRRRPRARMLVIVGSACGLALAAMLITISPGSSTPGAGPPRLAARFTLPVLGHPGKSVSLSQYAGRLVMVNFFSSTCAPCRQEAPLLARFYRSHHRQVAVVGIDVADLAASALRFARQAGISYPVGSDPAA